MIEARGVSPEAMKFRKAIPFLEEIPDAIYSRLDFGEFVLPFSEIADIRKKLESQLGHFVMTYRADTFNLEEPPERHLCANIRGTDLTPEQIKILQKYERFTKPQGISLVVYQNPMEVIDPYKSWLYDLYRNRRLISSSIPA